MIVGRRGTSLLVARNGCVGAGLKQSGEVLSLRAGVASARVRRKVRRLRTAPLLVGRTGCAAAVVSRQSAGCSVGTLAALEQIVALVGRVALSVARRRVDVRTLLRSTDRLRPHLLSWFLRRLLAGLADYRRLQQLSVVAHP